jgi:hypothetical protein
LRVEQQGIPPAQVRGGGRGELSSEHGQVGALASTAEPRGPLCHRRRGLGRIVGVARNYRREWRTSQSVAGRGKAGAMAVRVPWEGASPPRACRRLRLPRMRASRTQPPARVEPVYRVRAAHTSLDLA